ncbi:MAG: NADH-quinone oxidoreductase subunit N [Vulcanibacillus sp.]
MNLLELNWALLAPEFTIVIFATVITIVDLFMPNKTDRRILGWAGFVGIIIAIYFTLQQMNLGHVEYLLNNSYRVDSFGSFFKLIFLVGAGIVFVLSINDMDKNEIKDDGEYYYLLLTALLGSMLMASSADLITLYIGLELLSFSSYILVGIRKKSIKSNEASFKYILTGGVSSAIFIYGTSFIYGITGSTNLFVIAERLPDVFHGGFSFFTYIGFVLMFVGLSYKISVVPSYMWTLDVYEGAPTPITAFLSVVSKAAGFAIIVRIFLTSFGLLVTEIEVVNDTPIYTFFLFDEITIIFAVIAGLTMIVGNTLALLQTNIKRLFALSSVAQAGYIIIPLATMLGIEYIDLEVSNIIFYLIAYLIVNLGAFTIITIVNRDANSEDISSFRGLYHRSPLLGIAMTTFLLSLAGLPVTIGFIAKFNIFISAITADSYILAGIMLVTSVISYFYYFGIIKQMYMRPGETEARVKISHSLQLVILILFLATVLLGIFPNTIFNFINTHFNFVDLFTVGIGM